MIVVNPLTRQVLVLNHPGHSDQSVHGKKRQSLRDRFEKPMGGGNRPAGEILAPFGFEEEEDPDFPEYEELHGSLGTKGKKVYISRDKEHFPRELDVEFMDDSLGAHRTNKRLDRNNLKFLRKLKGAAGALAREGYMIGGVPVSEGRDRVYRKALSRMGLKRGEDFAFPGD